jgi:hypothetical protein
MSVPKLSYFYYYYMPPKEMRKHVAAHILRKHISPNACVLRRLWHSPHSFAKATGIQADVQCFSGYVVAFYYQLAITKGSCSTVPKQCPLSPLAAPCCCRRKAWRTTGPSHTLIISQDDCVIVLQKLP